MPNLSILEVPIVLIISIEVDWEVEKYQHVINIKKKWIFSWVVL